MHKFLLMMALVGCSGGADSGDDALDGVDIIPWECDGSTFVGDEVTIAGEVYRQGLNPEPDEFWGCPDDLTDRLEACIIDQQSDECLYQDFAEGPAPSCYSDRSFNCGIGYQFFGVYYP